MISFLIICPLVFLSGFIDAIAGGGGLVSIPAYLIAGIAPHNAIATNKLSSSMGTIVSTAKYIKKGYVDFKISIPCALMAIVSAPVGALIAIHINESVIKIVMLIILPIVAFYVFRASEMGGEKIGKFGKREYVLGMLIAFAMGLYDGFYGPGTGTFVLLLLTGVAKFDLNSAAGTTKVINLSSNLASLITFIVTGKVIFVIGIVAGLFSIAGHYIGSRCFIQNGTKIVRPVIITVIAILFLKIIFELFV